MPDSSYVAAITPTEADEQLLWRDESELVVGANPDRLRQFAAGRLGARQIFGQLGIESGRLLAARDGAPLWPQGSRGSITHKSKLGVVVAASIQTWSGVGVDLEVLAPLPAPVWTRVLVGAERKALRSGRTGKIEARVIFSAKEAYYKWYKSLGHGGEPRFTDIHVMLDGNHIRAVPMVSGRFPAMSGVWISEGGHVIALGWSGQSVVHAEACATTPEPFRLSSD